MSRMRSLPEAELAGSSSNANVPATGLPTAFSGIALAAAALNKFRREIRVSIRFLRAKG